MVQVSAAVTYADRAGQSQKITEQAMSGKTKHRLTDAEKHKRKLKTAKRIVRETIIELKRAGASDCRAASALAFSRASDTLTSRAGAAT